MNHKRRNLLLAVVGIVIIILVTAFAYRSTLVCCALPPLPAEYTASAIVALNKTTEALLHQTETAEWEVGIIDPYTVTPIPSPTALFPYDPTLYAQRRQEELMLRTGAGPTQYAIFFATEAALIATYQGTIPPTFTPIPYNADLSPTAPMPTTPPPYEPTLYAQRQHEIEIFKTAGGPTEWAIFVATETALVATYQGTVLPTFTPTPTLCPYSDIICPGGNETLSPAGQVMLLMASASAPEFGQLAQTATALYVTLTPSPTMPYVECAWSWARQDLPEVTEAAQAAFAKAGLENVTVRSEAYGEDCSDRATGKYMGFGAMSTDFYLSAKIDSFTDEDAIGQIITDAYNILMNLDVELPARHGYLDIEFIADGETKRFRTMFSQIESAVESQASAAALIKAGGGID